MRKLFKYMSACWKMVIVILLVLFVQAYCDLSLPAYTSDIVNVGIQQGGVSDGIPKEISQTDMDTLCSIVMSEDDRNTVYDSYELNKEKYDQPAYILKENVLNDEKKMDALKSVLELPMLFEQAKDSGMDSSTFQMPDMGDAMPEQNSEAGDMQQMSPEQLAQMTPEQQAQMQEKMQEQQKQMQEKMQEQMQEKMDEIRKEIPDSIVEQAAVSYVRAAYERLGIDMDHIQINYLLSTGGKMIALALLGMLASVTVGFLASRVGASVGCNLRSRVFKRVVAFSNNEFDQFSTASLITRSTNDIQQIQMLTVMLLRMVLYAPILAIGGIYQVFHTNVSMSWIIGLAVVLIGCVVLLLFTIVMPKFKIMQKLVDRINLVTREILTGLQVIRAFSTEKYEEKRFDKANMDLTRTNLFVNRAMTFMMPTMMLIMNGISVLIVWTGAHGIQDGQMQVGDMMAFIQYTMQIIMGFLMLCMISIMLPRAAVAADRVDEVLASKPTIVDKKDPQHFEGKVKGVLKFNDVSFRYPGAQEDVIEHVSFTANPGETTAIIGSTGSGKSTLVHLIPRFYDVTGGNITIDDVDIRDVSQHELREQLGFVPQKAVLFSGDIASNIMFGNPNGSEEEMKEAAEIAQAEEFIEEKPEAYESRISQGGMNVSGGQKQRLSIARAIAKHPAVFVFDDSFSALDYKTDVTLRKALHEKTQNSTVIIVAQRISTVLNAEQILVLDEGKIVGKGTHQQLLADCEVYRQIAKSQLSEEELGLEKEADDHE